jgi:hypothetical protein
MDVNWQSGSRDRRRALSADARRLAPTTAREHFLKAGRSLTREYPAGGLKDTSTRSIDPSPEF